MSLRAGSPDDAADAADATRSTWERVVVPRIVDAALKGREIGELRDQVCADLSGRVLEVGFGSGLNIRSLPPAVESVAAVEPSLAGWRMSEKRRARTSIPINRVGLDGERIEMPDASVDAVLCTFTLCTIPDVETALAEMRRVLVPGGRLHVLEHGRSHSDRAARWQDRLTPIQRRVAGGCHLNRDMPALIGAAGFGAGMESGPLPGMRGPAGALMHGHWGVVAA